MIVKAKDFLTIALYYLLSFFEQQLFLTLVSCPILVAWGLPISLAVALGNLLFFPLLTVMLILGSVIFFTELLLVPNHFFCWLFDISAYVWFALLQMGDKEWLIAYATPNIMISLALVILSCWTMTRGLVKDRLKRICGLSILLFLWLSYCSYNRSDKSIWSIVTQSGKKLTVVNYPKKRLLIDQGALASTRNPLAWVNYTIIPELIKNQGLLEIDEIIILNPSTMLFKVLALLCNKMKIKIISMPSWKGSLKNNDWAAWQELMEAIKKNNMSLKFITKPTIISLGNNEQILCTPTAKKINKNRYIYADTIYSLSLDQHDQSLKLLE